MHGRGQITLDGQTLPMPEPSAVLAPQNPIDMAGTYPLPEAQLDRFLIRLSLGYPDAAIEAGLINVQQFRRPISELQSVCRAGEFEQLVASAKAVHIAPEVAQFMAVIVGATPGMPVSVLAPARAARWRWPAWREP